MKNRLVYIVRLDDASPTMNHERWAAVEHLLTKYDIKPIVAVVPNNIDPVLVRSNVDPNFWERVRWWQSMGWHLAMHGYSHEALSIKKGLVPLHNKSEFAGVPESEQRRRIRLSLEIFRNNGVEPKIWVAPFHTFDLVTLRALLIETKIRIINDGVSRWPFSEMGFFWIPQQLWGPEEKTSGVWTICLHPNDTTETMLQSLEQLVLNIKSSFIWSLDALLSSFASRRRGASDVLQQNILVLNRNLQTKVSYQKIMSVASRCKRLFLRHVDDVKY
jgi:peptidoglycan/xylan/chitin deacetylase (PgdA/CDA1 family)